MWDWRSEFGDRRSEFGVWRCPDCRSEFGIWRSEFGDRIFGNSEIRDRSLEMSQLEIRVRRSDPTIQKKQPTDTGIHTDGKESLASKS